MEQNCCVLCQSALTSNNKLDIQLTTTKIGQVNVEEFLKEKILEVHANINLRSKFLCQHCYAAINTLEDHFLMYKSIQQTLLAKYNNLDIKQELFDDANGANEDIDEASDNSDPDFDPTSDKVVENKLKLKKSSKTTPGRKSTRKRTPIPKYTDQDKLVPQKKVKKVAKSVNEEPKVKTIDKVDDGDLNLPEQPAYCCEICGKQYVNYNGWNIHRRKHRNENLIRCEYCDKTFTQKIGLRRHLHMHTGTFPYECEICNKKFIHTSSFKIHKQIHAGKRDHICELCGMGFYTKPCLNRHMRSHTKEKRHGCERCGAMFTEKYNLNAHISKVHGREQEIQVSGHTF